jgi:hypothetical protein
MQRVAESLGLFLLLLNMFLFFFFYLTANAAPPLWRPETPEMMQQRMLTYADV